MGGEEPSPSNTAEPPVLESSDDMGPIEQKREIDETIAYATKSQEDSYADQIASLDVQGDNETGEATYAVTMRPVDGRDSPPRGPDEKGRETQVNPMGSDIGDNENLEQAPANAAAEEDPDHFSDEEFAKIEARIIEQVKSEKQA